MLTQFYPPTIGGEERHVHTLAHALARRGHHVAVATLAQDEQGNAPPFEDDGLVRVYRLPATTARAARFLYSDTARHHAPPLPDPETTWALRRVLSIERPEIVHAHNWLVYAYLPLAHRADARLVVSLHDYGLACPKKRLMRDGAVCDGPALGKCVRCASDHYGHVTGTATVLGKRLLDGRLRSATDHFLPVSNAVAAGNALAAAGVPFTVTPNFIPDDFGPPSSGVAPPAAADLPPDGYLLFVGDLTPEKGLPVLLHAYGGLQNPPPLVCIGRPTPDTPVALPPGAVLHHNWSHEAVRWAWTRSGIALVPSVWPDPCPTVAMEAMAMSRPVIAARSGGLPDIVAHGETGLVVPPGDAGALRDAIARLLTDPALAGRMGAAGRLRVTQFRAGAVVGHIEAVYAGVRRGRRAA